MHESEVGDVFETTVIATLLSDMCQRAGMKKLPECFEETVGRQVS